MNDKPHPFPDPEIVAWLHSPSMRWKIARWIAKDIACRLIGRRGRPT